MKKSLLCVALLGATLTQCVPSGSYVIQGTIDMAEAEGKTVYLMDSHTEKYTDSTKVVGGKFGFKGVVDAPMVCMVDVEGDLSSASLVLEEGEIQIAMLPRGFVQAAPHGTPRNEQLSAFLTESEKLYNISEKNSNDSTLTEQERDAQFEEQFNAMKGSMLEAFEANRDNQFGAYVLQDMAYYFSLPQFDSLLDRAGAVVHEYGPIKKVVAKNEKLRNTSAGKMFVDFGAKKTDNTTAVKLSDYVGKGKWVLADFWASWCGPCIAELPNLKTVYTKYKGKDLVVLGVNVWDNIDRCNEAIAKHQLPWESIVVDDRSATEAYGIDGIPHIILFAPDGVVAERGLHGAEMLEQIEMQLAAKK